jgi:hypothetical protein
VPDVAAVNLTTEDAPCDGAVFVDLHADFVGMDELHLCGQHRRTLAGGDDAERVPAQQQTDHHAVKELVSGRTGRGFDEDRRRRDRVATG